MKILDWYRANKTGHFKTFYLNCYSDYDDCPEFFEDIFRRKIIRAVHLAKAEELKDFQNWLLQLLQRHDKQSEFIRHLFDNTHLLPETLPTDVESLFINELWWINTSHSPIVYEAGFATANSEALRNFLRVSKFLGRGCLRNSNLTLGMISGIKIRPEHLSYASKCKNIEVLKHIVNCVDFNYKSSVFTHSRLTCLYRIKQLGGDIKTLMNELELGKCKEGTIILAKLCGYPVQVSWRPVNHQWWPANFRRWVRLCLLANKRRRVPRGVLYMIINFAI